MTDAPEPASREPFSGPGILASDVVRTAGEMLPGALPNPVPDVDGTDSGNVSSDRELSVAPQQFASTGANSSVTQAQGDVVNNYGRVLRDTSVIDGLAAVQSCFAPLPAAKSTKIDSAWQQSRLIVITGEQHVGKRSVALHLLSERVPEVDLQTVRELLPDWEKPDAGMLPRNRKRVFLLDLGDVPAGDFPARFGKELHDYVDKDETVRLVVTMTTAAWQRCGSDVNGVSVPISAPPAREVALRHLRRGGSARTEWVDDQTIGGLLTERTLPRDAARLATAIEHAPTAAATESIDGQAVTSPMPTAETVARVVDEYRSWRDYLRGFFGNDRNEVTDRALLLSAALLEGAAPAVVWRAAMLLLDGSALPKRAGELLAGPDLDTQLARIVGTDASEVTETVSLDMVRHGLSAAVLPHVWRQRSQMQTPLTSWIRAVSATDGPGSDWLPTIGRRLAELAAAVSDFDPVETLLSWLNSTPERRILAAELMGDIAEQDNVLAASVRGKTRSWAYAYSQREKRENTSAPQAELAAQICAGKFMRAYPNATLIRLKWLLAGPESATIRRLAGDTLRRMSSAGAAGDAVGVLQVVLGWRSDSAVAASRGFLALLDPDQQSSPFRTLLLRAAQDEEFAAQLRDGWHLATAQQETEDQAVSVLQDWAVAMDRDPDINEPALNVLIWLFSSNLRSSLPGKVFDPDQQDAARSLPIQKLMFAMMRRFSG